MNPNQKTFAFKLAEQNNKKAEKSAKWQARDGVAVAGCSIAFFYGEWDAWERINGSDCSTCPC